MTEEQLRELDGHWAAGMPIKQIAWLMCYSYDTIVDVLKKDRKRYPLRRKSFTQDERDAWADRVLSGELRSCEAARMLGVSEQTIYNWKRRRAAS